MAVSRMLQPVKSSWSANPECVTTVLKSIIQSTQSQPQKSQRSPEKVNTGHQQESQRSANFGQLFDLDFCANEYSLQKSNSPQNFSSNGPCVDQSQRWSNFPRNPNCRKFAAVNFVLFPRENCFSNACIQSEEEM